MTPVYTGAFCEICEINILKFGWHRIDFNRHPSPPFLGGEILIKKFFKNYFSFAILLVPVFGGWGE